MTVPASAAGASLGFRETEVVCAPRWPLCKSCLGINIERLYEGRGYTHSWLEELEETAKWCRLCSNLSCLLSTEDNQWNRYKIAPNRYKITLSLWLDPLRRRARPDHCHNSEFAFKCIEFAVLDTRPYRSPDDRAHPTTRNPKLKFFEREYLSKREHPEVSACVSMMLCYTQEGDRAMACGLPWLRNVEYTGSSGSMAVARGWLKQCLATDDRDFTEIYAGRDAEPGMDDYLCDDDDGDFFSSVIPFPAERPTRLLEIVPSAKDVGNPYKYSVKLIETEELEYKYAALSYCWGKMTLAPITHSWLTQRNTIEQHKEGIDVGCLPATIRDCIKVAFALGINYVWVDSLCIIQDDSSDWEAESAKMGGICRGACLTIAASRSNSSSSGLFNWKQGSHHLDPFDEYLCIENYLRSGEKSWLYFETSSKGWDSSPRRQLFGLEVYSSPLSQRAWVYQEQMLSRRILYFAESQLYWECYHCRLSQDNSRQEQSMREAYSIQNFKKPLTGPLFVRRWYCGAVEAYTKRALTYPEDRLVAISAVAKATYMNRQVRYIAGLWEDCLLAGLCWYRDSRGKKYQASLCPSWSWASQLSSVSYGEIDYRYEEEEGDYHGKYSDEELSFRLEGEVPWLYMAKVLNIQVELSEKNPFGHVRNGQIVLRTWAATGKVTRDRLRESNLHFEGYSGDGERLLSISENNAQSIRTGTAVLDDDGREDQGVLIAMVIGWEDCWLVLALDMADEETQRYSRVGLGIMEGYSEGKPDLERDWTKRDITII